MDAIDRKLLNLIQEDFPITAAPFAEVAVRLGIGEAEVLDRIRRLKAKGIIRRIGAVFDLRKLGFVSTLCAPCPRRKNTGICGCGQCLPRSDP